MRPPTCEVIPEETNSGDREDRISDSGPLLVSSPVNVGFPVPEPQTKEPSNHWVRELK